MSNDSLFPEEEKSQLKQPEFTLIDEREGETQYTRFGVDASRLSHESTQTEQSQAPQGNVSLRFICLLGFIFCLIFGLGILVWSIVLTVLATLSFFQNRELNKGAHSFWKIFMHTAIAGFGFTLGMLSPTLGLGLIALYFSVRSEMIDNAFLRTVIRRSFNQL